MGFRVLGFSEYGLRRVYLPSGSMYPNSIYFGPKVPMLGLLMYSLGTWTLRDRVYGEYTSTLRNNTRFNGIPGEASLLLALTI